MTGALGAATWALGADVLGRRLSQESWRLRSTGLRTRRFAAVFAVLSGIELLLFFEDFVAAAFLASFAGALARPLVALRLAGGFFRSLRNTLFTRFL